jgi:hypothetical protein
VGDVIRQAQTLMGERAHAIGEQTAEDFAEDVPTPDGRIGDIKSPPR